MHELRTPLTVSPALAQHALLSRNSTSSDPFFKGLSMRNGTERAAVIEFKFFGVTMAAAVLIDATIVRGRRCGRKR